MEDQRFRRGDEAWLRGRQVAFIDVHPVAPELAAIVRRHDEEMTRVVPLWKLARNRAESLTRRQAGGEDAA